MCDCVCDCVHVRAPRANGVLPVSACVKCQDTWEEAGRRGGPEILWVLCLGQEEDTVTAQGHSSRIQFTLALS